MKRMIGIHTVTVAIALGLAATGLAQTGGFQELLSGKSTPLTLKFKDLNEQWRRFATSSAGEANAALLAMYGRGGASSVSVYYTKGETVTVGSETYLIAYRAQMKALDLIALQQAMMRGGGQPPEPERPGPQTTLCLALLNLRTTGSFTDVRPFNLEFELTGSETAGASDEEKHAQEINKTSQANLRKLGTAVILYERERKALPVLTDANAAQQDLALYVSDKAVFVQPETKKPYQPNPALTAKRLSEVAKPEKTIVFFEAEASADGTRGVLYLDGHADRVPDAIWAKIKPAAPAP